MKQMDRRNFLKVATGAGIALTAEIATAPAPGQSTKPTVRKLCGVNLGGWLVLERWITPTLYDGVDAEDEYTLCQKLGSQKAAARLQKHREEWITPDDFRWLASRGINAVRLPVGYAVLEENAPYISGAETLDLAFRTAKENGLGVLLDLHGVPGSQNGWDHSGRSGELGWHTSPDNIAHSLRIIEGLAEFCKGRDNLIGIELVNEPRKDVPLDILQTYYQDAYERVRRHVPAEQAAVVFHDGFRPTVWGDFMTDAKYRNVFLDTHLYQCFNEDDKDRELHAQIEVAVMKRKEELDGMREHHRCIVGEWSCSLPRKSMHGLRGLALETAMRAYGAAQLLSYETAEGWFFWTYRTEANGAWNFRSCAERGWLPGHYDG
jgi:glucan 1,3-beta-glucosidase